MRLFVYINILFFLLLLSFLYLFIMQFDTLMIHSNIPDSQQEKKEPKIERIIPLPSVLIGNLDKRSTYCVLICFI